MLLHTAYCAFLNPELKEYGKLKAAAAGSLGAQLELGEIAPDSAAGSQSKDPVKPKPTDARQSQLELDFRRVGTAQLQQKIDHCIVKLICVNGLVPHILDSPEWEEFMAVANPKYKVTPSDKFEDQYIPAEAQYVQQKVMEVLCSSENLTLSFDGVSTRKPESVYTMHVTTKERNSYFINGYEGSDEHHTAAWVTDKISKVR
jgi:hypothetical protein